jgi:hypothetical protein
MKQSKLITTLTLGLSLLVSMPGLANTVVTPVDADTLRVVEFAGKPPHKRLTVSRDAQPELFAHYAERVDYNPQPLFASERRAGAPGKNLTRSFQRVSADQLEIAEFARFEEARSGEGTVQRAWRGAPGKGRALVR